MGVGKKCHRAGIRTLLRFAAFGSMVVLTACGTGLVDQQLNNVSGFNTQALTTSCIIPNGIQDNSLQGHWQTVELPLKISFHSSSNWSGGELSAMMSGANTWNSFYTAARGGTVLNYGSTSSPNASALNESVPDCGVPSVADGTVFYKRGLWTKGAGIIALTSFCIRRVSGQTLPLMYHAIIEMNYQNFFAAGTGKYPDLQSIATHELGHLLGLDHSCGQGRNGDNVACPPSAAADPNRLYSTIMFPTWTINSSTGAGEIKRTLTANDQGRASCLY